MELLKKLKSRISSSLKSVVLNFREFVGLYISVIIVQLLLGVWTLSAFTNFFASDALFDSNYTYDVTVSGRADVIVNISNRLRYDVMTDEATFEDFAVADGVLGVVVKDGEFDGFYEEYLKKFHEDGRVEYTLTPKYIYHTEIQGNIITSSAIIGIVAFIVGIFILAVMYSVRTNHYKFQYGIYMTFGADKKMLGSIATGELLAINTITLIPSFIISCLLLLLVYGGAVSLVVNFRAVLIYIVLSYATVFIAACSSVGELFIKPPVSLITTADNSNFVSSPRRSFNIFGKKIPLHYELITSWRFRKYLARLVLGAVAFSVIFVTGIYCANMLKTENDSSKEAFVLSYRYSTNVEDLRDQANREAGELVSSLLDVDGVERVTFEQSEKLPLRMDHILLKPGTEISGSNFTVPSIYEAEGYNRALNYCRYVSVDAAAMEMYERSYDIEYLEGYDIDEIVADDGMVVVSEGLYGAKCFDFEPGDKIVVARFVKVNNDMPVQSDPLDILKVQINNCSFEYKEYTVGAVIHDTDATESIIVGLSENEYYNYTKDKRAISKLTVYSSAGLGLEDISAMRDSVADISSDYVGWHLSVEDAPIYAIVDERIALPSLLYLLSILVLMISPIVWIFSQIMFYKKREPEFRMLQAMGATLREIGGIHAVSGCVIFIVGFITNFILSRLLCYVIYRIFTSILPHLGIMGMNTSFNSFVPVSTVLIYAGVSAVCGLISSLIPFILYKKKLEKEEKELNKFEIS